MSPQINGFRQTESVYLERFFRNLLLNEKWDLRNRYLHIHPTEEWNEQPNIVGKPTDYPTSTRQVPDKLKVNPNIMVLIQSIGNKEKALKEIMAVIGLKDRDNFLKLYLNPAIKEGLVRMLYPNSPRLPRQKYLLTPMGPEVYKRRKWRSCFKIYSSHSYTFISYFYNSPQKTIKMYFLLSIFKYFYSDMSQKWIISFLHLVYNF